MRIARAYCVETERVIDIYQARALFFARDEPRRRFLKRDVLLKHWNGRFLLAQLTEASKPAHYAHCYFYGRLVDHPKWGNRVVVEVDLFEHLAFTVRKKGVG